MSGRGGLPNCDDREVSSGSGDGPDCAMCGVFPAKPAAATEPAPSASRHFPPTDLLHRTDRDPDGKRPLRAGALTSSSPSRHNSARWEGRNAGGLRVQKKKKNPAFTSVKIFGVPAARRNSQAGFLTQIERRLLGPNGETRTKTYQDTPGLWGYLYFKGLRSWLCSDCWGSRE